MFSIYSRALSKLTAPVMLGVQGSNLSGSEADLKLSFLTHDIAQPPEILGFSSSKNSFFHHNTPIPLSAITLCPVKNKASHHNSCTSTLKCGILWDASTK